MSEQDSPKRALSGLRVLELAGFVAGPYLGKLLADNGADVVKVEPPGCGDEARSRGPFPDDVPHPERSALFLYLNTNKRGITLDVHQERGRELFKRLVAGADVLIEDQPPRLMEELGLTYDELKAQNAGLIVTSITPFGQTGPYRDHKAYYLNTFHGSGFGYLTPASPGNPEVLKRPPIMLPGFLAEYYSGVIAGIATLGAVFSRRFSGEGQHIDVAKLETPLLQQKESIATCSAGGEVLNRCSVTGASTWGGVLPCKDGFVQMGGSQPHQFAAVLKMMNNAELLADDRFRPENIHLHGAEMQPFVKAWVAERNREEIWHNGQRRGAPLASLNTIGEVVESPHLKARGFFVEIDHAEAGRLSYPSVPYRLSATPVRFERAAPLLGEHNQEVFGGLGLDRKELAALKREGVV